MSLELTKPVTDGGVLKLTQAEFNYLKSFLTTPSGSVVVGDRGGSHGALQHRG